MLKELEERIAISSKYIDSCRKEIGRRVIGQNTMIDGILMALIAEGHVLLEGVPGIAKTLAVKTLSEVIDTGFKRLQFTPSSACGFDRYSYIPAADPGICCPERSGVFKYHSCR